MPKDVCEVTCKHVSEDHCLEKIIFVLEKGGVVTKNIKPGISFEDIVDYIDFLNQAGFSHFLLFQMAWIREILRSTENYSEFMPYFGNSEEQRCLVHGEYDERYGDIMA